MGSDAHRLAAADTPVRCAVLTVSDTRTEATDKSGRYLLDVLGAAAVELTGYAIVADDPADVRREVDRLASGADVVLINGGTGISKRDNTYEAVQSMLEKTLPGFGEIFRVLSYDDVGPAAMLSRATAGIYRDTILFSMPGSTGAVRLAMEKLILPELKHLVWELVRQHTVTD